MKYTVDRIESGFAVCEDENGNLTDIELAILPEGVSEGDIIRITDGETVVLKEETDERRRKIAEKRKAVFERKRVN